MGVYIVGTYLVHPPSGGKSTVVNGRTYNTVAGTPIQAPDFDVPQLEANGWLAVGLTGTTAQRPVNPPPKTVYIDTTLSSLHIVWDGKLWRNTTSGASV
jgi:hypothetical protein